MMALKHLMKANVLAMQGILEVRPDAIFIQSESSEYYHAEKSAVIKPAEQMNAKRFLSLDLNYGQRVNSEMQDYLLDNGITRDEYHFFRHGNPKHNASWATTTTKPTSTAWLPMAVLRPLAKSSAITPSRPSITTATICP